ncbi:hypothetical protein JTB14_028378 [Gonioctena quinquepunctata]|nr:hypothetical protein JTB14_028378 [Gonioctena quinquepunctata]
MADIRKLASRRGVLKGQLTRFNEFFNAFENEQARAQATCLLQLQARLVTITDIYSEYDNVQSEIEFLSPDDDIDVNNENRNEFETKYFDSVARAKKGLSNVQHSS